jgi:tripartite-type tricarboxylate transporter receptor subunit TctC
MNSLRLFAFSLVAATLAMAGAGAADTYPSKPVKIVVSTSAGGITDLGGRLVGQQIAARTGQTVVIDNRSGAGGNIAMEAVAKSAPDGYTLGFANTGNIVINPFLYSNMGFDPLKDLVPVAPIGTVPLFLVVPGSLPVNSLQEFIAYAKAGKYSYGSAGAGTTPHLAGEAFVRRAGLDMVHVPYRGSTPATMAVLTGEVPMTFVSLGQHQELVRQGRLKVLAVASDKRVPYLPDVPTFEEQGFPGFFAGTWFALFAPAGTPKEIVDQLNGYVREFVANPESKKHYDTSFIDPISMSAPDFAALVKADADRWQQIVRETGVRLN